MRDLKNLDDAALAVLSIALNGYQEHEKTNTYVSRLFLDIVELLVGSIQDLSIWGIRDLLAKENKRRARTVTVRVVSPTDFEGIGKLGKQELLVLRLIGQGQRSEDIVRLLSISYRTLANHKARIAAKLGLGSARDLLKFAIDNLMIL
ncbi:helix-turn-helix transcriptional regulator [Spirosoma agri]|uniref:Helix-turn-helix transcriptional regulator n=1 Tax=Spirosoma agri TaxID=1987381 RepID=A0A6M0IJH8_9BACT|nr:helix-turn-helix transcriptional regulator [Spirosoma agri]NEU67775.1 helix-turn-helix transcriptional regulator [Spirosoma agri]